MMRKLLLFFAMLTVSIGAWAAPGDEYKVEYDQGTSAGTETVLKIKIGQTGHLSAAIAEAQNSGNSFQYLLLETEPAEATVTLSSDDIAALNGLNVSTINLTKANLTDFTLKNANVNYIILPYDLTKEQVKAVGEAHKNYANFKNCFSTSNTPNKPQGSEDATLVAYLNEAGSLADGIKRTYYIKNDPNHNSEDPATLGNTVYQGGGDCSRLRYLHVMGNFCAKDISSQGVYDSNGHYVINGVADENSTVWNRNTDGGNLYETQSANAVPGALKSCQQLYVIDLKDGYVPDEYATDIVVGYNGTQATNLREVWMPEDSRFKTVPADYLNINSEKIRQICIPGNIENILTRAFAGSGTMINYVWTTGPDATTKYDNGAYFVSGETTTLKYKVNPDPEDPENITFADGDDNTFTYGTITLPPNLKLIERHAFASSVKVKDVYVLNETAPECHVDAFNSVLYHANNTIANDAIKEEDGVKIITRDAYTMSGYQMMAVLHYPRTAQTPQTQRYTDPSRDYNIATGERDGNGNMLYFPTQTEFETAHAQGTYGYLWGAWNTERTWYNNEKTLGTSGGWYGDICGTDGHDTANGQSIANQFYINNPNEDPDFDKTKNVFYDVTLGDDNQPGGYNKPSDLADYWTIERRGIKLYPQMETTTTTEVIGQRQSMDSEGHLMYAPGDCNFVQDYSYVQDNGGTLYWDRTVTENEYGNYVQDYSVVAAENGDYYYPLLDRNNDGNKPKPWYLRAENYVACSESEATHVWPQGSSNQGYRVTIEDWNAKKETEYSWAYQGGNGSFEFCRLVATYQQNNDSGNYYIGSNLVRWSSTATDIAAGINATRYNKIYADDYRAYNASTDAGEQRYDVVDNGLRAYNSETDTDNSKRYNKVYKDYTYREFDSSKDAADEPRYCPVMEDVFRQIKGKQNDYRGWHQFVLAATAHNSTIPFEPLRSWISDCDWWTICEPYDLRYSDLVKFFGYDRQGFEKKIPYLSKLMYVIRDVENQKITLMFSKNLMEYKEVMAEGDGIVHGTIDEQTKWPAQENGINLGEEGYDPIILHAGVPYLIRPNLVAESGSSFQRQFDIYKNQDPDLYARLKASQDISAGKQFQMVYNGEYTVPAYVVGYDKEGAVSESTVDSKTITNEDGSSFTYTSGTIKYNGKNVSYKISDDFSYTFVGTFYKSAMPQYCYFLGYDSAKKKAVFRYSHVLDKDGWNWNNETGIICPNFDTTLAIHQASSMNDPARWVFNPSNKTDNVDDYVKCDDFPVGSSSGGSAKQFTMDFGASSDNVITGISEMKVLPEATVKDTKIYTLDGISVGTSVKNLPKGIYIVNGKKYVVK